MKKWIFLFFVTTLLYLLIKPTTFAQTQANWWSFRSIDTMKYSRDVAREKLVDAKFRDVIDQQVKDISETGASHVAIATPYDEEFYPFLKAWVDAARKYKLNVWFRGNFSGWEKWFDYPKITRSEHLQKTREFIEKHAELFKDGDVFTACPECENGGPGDPRQNGDVDGHRQFLIDEYLMTSDLFRKQKKQIVTNYNSMNGDVARLIMDKNTAKALGGIVAIDHYVSTPQKLADDIVNISRQSDAKIILGEFGAPIPDINGKLTEEEQAKWINEAMKKLVSLPELEGLNYWVNTGGSTELWDQSGRPRKAVSIISQFYKPKTYQIITMAKFNKSIAGVSAEYLNRKFISSKDGVINMPYFDGMNSVKLTHSKYIDKIVNLEPEKSTMEVQLEKIQPHLLEWLIDLIYRIFHV